MLLAQRHECRRPVGVVDLSVALLCEGPLHLAMAEEFVGPLNLFRCQEVEDAKNQWKLVENFHASPTKTGKVLNRLWREEEPAKLCCGHWVLFPALRGPQILKVMIANAIRGVR